MANEAACKIILTTPRILCLPGEILPWHNLHENRFGICHNTDEETGEEEDMEMSEEDVPPFEEAIYWKLMRFVYLGFCIDQWNGDNGFGVCHEGKSVDVYDCYEGWIEVWAVMINEVECLLWRGYQREWERCRNDAMKVPEVDIWQAIHESTTSASVDVPMGKIMLLVLLSFVLIIGGPGNSDRHITIYRRCKIYKHIVCYLIARESVQFTPFPFCLSFLVCIIEISPSHTYSGELVLLCICPAMKTVSTILKGKYCHWKMPNLLATDPHTTQTPWFNVWYWDYICIVINRAHWLFMYDCVSHQTVYVLPMPIHHSKLTKRIYITSRCSLKSNDNIA